MGGYECDFDGTSVLAWLTRHNAFHTFQPCGPTQPFLMSPDKSRSNSINDDWLSADGAHSTAHIHELFAYYLAYDSRGLNIYESADCF